MGLVQHGYYGIDDLYTFRHAEANGILPCLQAVKVGLEFDQPLAGLGGQLHRV